MVSVSAYFVSHILIGTLNVDVNDGSWNNGVWSLSGQQHSSGSDPYTQAVVDLSSYTGPITIRFRAVAAGGSYGDMAIDDIEVTSDGTSAFIYGDTNDDGVVGLEDLAGFVANWVDTDCDQAAELDLNDDCIINFYEFASPGLNWL